MRIPIRMAAILLGVGLSLAVQAQEKRTLRIRCQIFEIKGGFQSKTSTGQKNWYADDEAMRERIGNTITFFERAEFAVWKHNLKMDQTGCYWNDKKLDFKSQDIKLPEQKVKLIYATYMDVREKSVGKILISSRQPYQYFVKRKDGLFELKERNLPTGLDIKLKPFFDAEGDLRLYPCQIFWRFIPARRNIEGVDLNVGEPILRKVDYDFGMRATLDTFYGMVIKPYGGHGAIIVRFSVSELDAQADAGTGAGDMDKEVADTQAKNTPGNLENGKE